MIRSTRPAPHSPADSYTREWLAAHLTEERRGSALLGELREIVFGAQDGLVSILTVVATVAGATLASFPILVAGAAAGLAGVFSMAAGEYISSKSQREIFEAQIAGEELEVRERPGEAEAEVAFLLNEDGLPVDEAGSSRPSLHATPTCSCGRWWRRSSGSPSRTRRVRRCRGPSSWARRSARERRCR